MDNKKTLTDRAGKLQDFSHFLSQDEISDIYNVTVLKKHVKGTKEHYVLAGEMMANPCRRIFLMQRSSSLILGDEEGWQEEGDFLRNILAVVNDCEAFYHVITLEGIEAHIRRADSVFPQFAGYPEMHEHAGG